MYQLITLQTKCSKTYRLKNNCCVCVFVFFFFLKEQLFILSFSNCMLVELRQP